VRTVASVGAIGARVSPDGAACEAAPAVHRSMQRLPAHGAVGPMCCPADTDDQLELIRNINTLKEDPCADFQPPRC